MRELVVEAGLGLVSLTGDVGLDNVIQGIHLSDLEDPTPWMTSGMVLVTTGVTFATSPDIGLRLLDRLKEREAVALGVGVGHYVEKVPDAMVERARFLRIAIFESPIAVPFRTIVKYVYNALASSDMHGLKRSLSMQTRLLDCLIDGKGAEDLIANLAALLRIPTVLFDAGGRIVAPSSPDKRTLGIAGRLWDEYSQVDGSAVPVRTIESASHRLYYRDVQLHGVVERILAAAAPQASASELIETSLSFVQRLLALELLRSEERLLTRRRIRSILLDDVLAERGSGGELEHRLREQDIDLTLTWRLLCIELEAHGEDGVENPEWGPACTVESAVLDEIDECLSSESVSYLSLLQQRIVRVLVVVGGTPVDEVKSILRGLCDRLEIVTGSRVAAGCSGPALGLARVRAAMNQGTEALQHALAVPGDGARLFEELPRALRLNGQDPEAMTALHERFIVPLVRHDEIHHTLLVSTLRAWFTFHLSAHLTADSLLVHRNTLRKRLQRIEAILDVDLDSMDDVLELYVALCAGELHPEPLQP